VGGEIPKNATGSRGNVNPVVRGHMGTEADGWVAKISGGLGSLGWVLVVTGGRYGEELYGCAKEGVAGGDVALLLSPDAGFKGLGDGVLVFDIIITSKRKYGTRSYPT